MGAWRAGGGRANVSAFAWVDVRAYCKVCARVGWIVDCEMWTGGQQMSVPMRGSDAVRSVCRWKAVWMGQ